MEKKKKADIDVLMLPNGVTVSWKENAAGGRTYISDEIPGGVVVWNTALVQTSTLLASLCRERVINAEHAQLPNEDWVSGGNGTENSLKERRKFWRYCRSLLQGLLPIGLKGA